MFGILEAIKVPEEGIYSSYNELFEDISGRMQKDGYKIVKERSHRSRTVGGSITENEIIRVDLACNRGGRPYRSSAKKHRSSTKKTGCPWKAKAVHRKSAGGWVLTMVCDQHNHEPGTPEPPTPPERNDADEEDEGPRPDQDTAAALQIAGLSESSLRLTGDTFNQFKNEYRKMSQADRLQLLSHFQLRIAAIFAVQNEDMQRQRRLEAQEKRNREVEANRRQSGTASSKKRQRQNADPDDDYNTGQLQQRHRSQALGHAPLFQLAPPQMHASMPMGNAFIPQFQQYPAPPKDMSGQQPSTSSQSAS